VTALSFFFATTDILKLEQPLHHDPQRRPNYNEVLDRIKSTYATGARVGDGELADEGP
jgi:hypothetical protein